MAGKSPAELIEVFGAAWARHDLDAAMELLSEDCVFEATGPAPDGVRHAGPASIRAAWQAIFDDDSTRFEPEETVVMGERAVQRWRYEWDGGHVRGVDLFRIRGDEIVEKLSYVKG